MANKSSKFQKGIVLEPQTSAPSSPVKGEAYYDNNDNKLKIHNGTTFKQALDADDLSTHESDTSTHGVGTIVGTTETQTLTNKDIDGGTASNSNRITLPKASKATLDGLTRKEATLVYASDLDKVYYDDGTNLRAVGSGDGSGINYIENGDFEIGTTGWTGDTNLVISEETTSPLRGTRSLKIAKSAANASTRTVKRNFTIDSADLSKQLVGSFDYDFSDANYLDGYARVQIVQDPSGTPVTIRVNGEDIKAGKGTHYFRFQTDSTELDYQLQIYWVNTGTTAVNAYIDDVKVGPKSIIYGSPITDMKADTGFTSSLTGTISAKSRRVGDSKEVELSFAYSSGTGIFEITPTVDALDELKISLEGDRNNLGTAYIFDTDTAANRRLGIVYWNDTTKAIGIILDAGSGVSNTSPFTMVAGDDIQMRFTYPVAGWSANAAMSEDFSGRDVYARLTLSANESFADSAVEQILNFTASSDTTSSWSDTNDRYTVPETGYYDISLSLFFTSNLTGTRLGAIYVNGVEQSRTQVPAGSNLVVKTDAVLLLNKGDLITFYGFQSSGGALNLESSLARTYAYIAKRSSAQQLFETETVAAAYTSDFGLSNTNTLAVKIYEDKILDTHNAYNTSTGEYIVPVTGIYEATHKVYLATHTPSSDNQNCQAAIYVDGVNVDSVLTRPGTIASTNYGALVTMKARLLNKGQVVTFRASSSDLVSLTTSSDRVGFEIKRIK